MTTKRRNKHKAKLKSDVQQVSSSVGKLLDQRAEALARDPNQKKYTLQEIVARLRWTAGRQAPS